MTMGWIETIRFIGLDLEIATVFAVASLDLGARTLKRLVSTRAGRFGSSAVTQNTKLCATNPDKENVTRFRPTVQEGTWYVGTRHGEPALQCGRDFGLLGVDD